MVFLANAMARKIESKLFLCPSSVISDSLSSTALKWMERFNIFYHFVQTVIKLWTGNFSGHKGNCTCDCFKNPGHRGYLFLCIFDMCKSHLHTYHKAALFPQGVYTASCCFTLTRVRSYTCQWTGAIRNAHPELV